MNLCTRFLRVTRRVTLNNFKRPLTMRHAFKGFSVKVVPPLVEYATHNPSTFDLKDVVSDIATCETVSLTLQVILVLISIESKNMYKPNLRLGDPMSKNEDHGDPADCECVLTCYQDPEGQTYCALSEGRCDVAPDEGDGYIGP